MTSSTQTTLQIKQLPGEPVIFQVTRPSDGKASPPAVVPSPIGFPVAGRPDSDLMTELRWYLEEFLDYPFPPQTEQAEHVRDALHAWGGAAFNALFGDRVGGGMFTAVTKEDYSRLHLQIWSDDPQVLAWPWEALRDSEAAVLAHTCQIERRLNKDLRDPQDLPAGLPTDRVNILLVTARPYERDVRYRSLSRPLVELIEKHRLPAHVDVLRPPTFDQLREHLRQHPGHYHILHFDGHGAYGATASDTPDGFTLQGAEGQLIFEKDEGGADPVSAQQLSALLREYAVPAVVLNACQSAMLDHEARDPFASVAAALLKSGMRGVVAMAYSLYVSGAQRFLPAFYRRLFEEGSVAQAVRAGRQQMLAQQDRVCARGEFPLEDWLVPVLYQQDPFDFSFASAAKGTFKPRPSKLPEQMRRARNPYGFVGRDGPLLALERALRRAPAGILIQGLGGVGKTTLARGFCQWLDATDGLGAGCLWFSLQDIRSAESVLNRTGEALLGPRFSIMEDRVEKLVQVLREERVVMVWDNFEVVETNLSEADRGLLGEFLERLRGGASKVLITSRSTEDWLGPTRRYVLPVSGLEGEERWDLCAVILSDLGKTIDRKDPDLVKLMALLRGHPLAMRVILPRLERMTAAQVVKALHTNLAGLGLPKDVAQAHLFAILRFVEQSLPQELKPLLLLLGLHEGFVDADFLEEMAKQVDAQWTRARIDALVQALLGAGLLQDQGQAVYEMHPVLTGYLRSTLLKDAAPELRDAWTRPFVDVMGSVADGLAPRQLHEQRSGFFWHGANFHHALGEAGRLGMDTHFAALTQALAFYAQNTRSFKAAADLFTRFAEHANARAKSDWEARAYHQLGMIAQEQRDFDAAKAWYPKSLAIDEKLGNEHGAALSYGQLGILAQEQRDFDGAKVWYVKSLATFEKLGNEHDAATSYHQLGILAQEQRDFDAAKGWFLKALAISEKLDIEHYAALSYGELGILAQEQRDFDVAKGWYLKSLAISEKLGIEYGAASSYHHLGMIAEEQRDFEVAKAWYLKSLAIFEKQGNEHGAAASYHQLGNLAGLQGHFDESGRWLLKGMVAFLRMHDQHHASMGAQNFHIFYRQAPPAVQDQLKSLWTYAGLPWEDS